MTPTQKTRVILLVGLPGVGKTTLARELAPALNAVLLNRDDIRDAIFPARFLDYTPEQNEVATRSMLSVLDYLLLHATPPVVIIDGKPFSRRAEIRAVHDLVVGRSAELVILHCVAPESVVAQRLRCDLKDERHARASRDPAKAERIRQVFEPIDLPHCTVDTTAPPSVIAKMLLQDLGLDSGVVPVS